MKRIQIYLIVLISALSSAAAGPGRSQGPTSGAIPDESDNKKTGHAQLVVQLSHSDYISAMTLSHNGRLLVTSGFDETVRLWDAVTGRELRRIEGHKSVVRALALSPDAQFLLTGSSDRTARLWMTRTGEEIIQLNGHSLAVTAVAVSPDGTLLLTGSDDMTVRLWDRKTGHELRTFTGFLSGTTSAAFSPDGRTVLIGSHVSPQVRDIETGLEVRRFIGHSGGVTCVEVSPDGTLGLSGSLDKTARLWDMSTGQEVRRLEGHSKELTSVRFSHDGTLIVTAGKDGTVRIWEVKTGKEIFVLPAAGSASIVSAILSPDGQTLFIAAEKTARSINVKNRNQVNRFEGNSDLVSSAAFSPDGKLLLIGSWDNVAHLWDVAGGAEVQRLKGHKDDVRAVAFSPDGRFILTGGRDNARLWKTDSGRGLHTFTGHKGGVRPVAFSPDGSFILTGGDDKMVMLWEAEEDYVYVRSFGPHEDRVAWASFSPDGTSLLTASADTLTLWDTAGGEVIKKFTGHTRPVNSVSFSPDGRFAVSSSWDGTVRVWDIESGLEIRRLEGHEKGAYSAVYSPTGRLIATGSDGGTVRFWDAKTGEQVRELIGHTSGVIMVAFSPNERFIVSAGMDQTARIWDTVTGEELCRLVSFNNGSWAVTDKEGRFDASHGGDIQGLHWVVGNETIALSQLKERYYEPGLLAKKLGLNTEPLREVKTFSDPKLFPEVETEMSGPGDSKLSIRLTNRGGGIGRVVVLLNGKEIASDARGPAPDPDAGSISLEVPVAGHPYLIPGKENVIEVRAFNAEGYLSSRGVSQVFSPPGEALKEETLWAIVAGISDYEGENLDLRYAAKDARDMARALKLGAGRLFGMEKVKLTLLTSDKRPGEITPTRAHFEKVFAEAEAARPGDILVVYLAGHGVMSGDEYFYLTSEARSTDLSDPAVRKSNAVSSEELVKWLKQSPALKQVMILDTCAAGGAAARLVEKRDISSDQIRAIERLKDRTGFHVLMGSAADAVSYEATQYEQGLLTYSLLLGMRGAALRAGEFLDVSTLFQYAADEVPQLAIDIGGIQRPRIAAPRGTSFDIGQLIEEDRKAIPLSLSKPMIVQPVLLNDLLLYDDLKLTSMVRKRFQEASYASLRGESKLSAVYVKAEELSGAIRPSGKYWVEGDTLTAKVVLVRNGLKLGDLQVQGSQQRLEDFADRIVEAILKAVREIP